MFRNRFTAAALIVAAIVIVGFALSVPHASEGPKASKAGAASSSTPAVSVQDSYNSKKGVHTITGSVVAPDACTTLTATSSVSSASTTTIEVAITMPPDEEPCLEVATPVPFSVSAEAPQDAAIVVSVNGTNASTTDASAHD